MVYLKHQFACGFVTNGDVHIDIIVVLCIQERLVSFLCQRLIQRCWAEVIVVVFTLSPGQESRGATNKGTIDKYDGFLFEYPCFTFQLLKKMINLL